MVHFDTMVRHANDYQKEQFLKAVSDRDAEKLREIASVDYPTVVWVKTIEGLGNDDKCWVEDVLTS